MDLSAEQRDRLADSLSEMFGETVGMRVLRCEQLGDATLAVVEMSYTRTHQNPDGPNSTTRIEQSAVVLEDEQVDVPQFAVSPRLKGLLGQLMSALSGMADVEFGDTPRFSSHYRIHAWNETAAKILFTTKIRDFLGEHPGWSVRGQRHRIVVFKHDEVCNDDSLEEFVEQSLQVLQLFQEGEEQLDQRPEIHRETRVEDMQASVDRMGGIAGAVLRNHLQKIAVSREELETFLQQPVPRDPPRGATRQVVGDNLFLIVFGLVFLLGGLLVGVITATQLEGKDRAIAVLLATVFAAVGALVMTLAIRHRTRKLRTLREGRPVDAKITNVKRTDVSINNQRRYHVTFRYSDGGADRSTTANVYSNIEMARVMQSQGDTARLLIDPRDENHVVCLDLLVIMN